MNERSDSELLSVAAYAWALAVVVPGFSVPLDPRTCTFATLLLAISLALGMGASRSARPALAPWPLVAVAPLSIAAPVAFAPSNVNVPTWAWALAFVATPLYAVAALRFVAAPAPDRVFVLENVREAAFEMPRTPRRRALFDITVAAGAVALLFAPTLIVPRDELARAWPGLEREAELLSAVVSCAMATVWVGVLAAQAMRRPRERDLPTRGALTPRIVVGVIATLAFSALAWLLR